MRFEDKFRMNTEEEMAEERRVLEERDEWYARWHPALGPQCCGERGTGLDAYKA